MSAAVDRVIEALGARGFGPKRNSKGWSARCPLHEDRKPSLSISEGNGGRALIYCHVCGRDATKRIVEVLGLTMADLSASGERCENTLQRMSVRSHSRTPATDDGQTRGRIVAEYDYRDESGALLFKVVRYDPKAFRQCQPEGNRWIWNVQGVRRVLYRLPELVAADRAVEVYVPEGEKDVEKLAAIGLVATCNPMGAGKWGKVEDATLEGRHVVIVPDHDDIGEKHAQDVAQRLHGRAASVRVLRLPLSDGGKDASDFIEEQRLEGKDDTAIRRAIEDLAAAAPVWATPSFPLAPQGVAPAAIEPPLDQDQARIEARRLISKGKRLRSDLQEFCIELATYADRDGPTHYSYGYIASALGVTRQRIHQWAEAGRLFRSGVSNHLTPTLRDDLSDVHVLPLLALRGNPAQIQSALERAEGLAREEHKRRQQKANMLGRVAGRLRLKRRHVVESVRAIIGCPEPPDPAGTEARLPTGEPERSAPDSLPSPQVEDTRLRRAVSALTFLLSDLPAAGEAQDRAVVKDILRLARAYVGRVEALLAAEEHPY